MDIKKEVKEVSDLLKNIKEKTSDVTQHVDHLLQRARDGEFKTTKVQLLIICFIKITQRYNI